MSFLSGLVAGFTNSLSQGMQQRQQSDAQTFGEEQEMLKLLASTSENPDIRAAALTGLIELTRGGGRRGGILGLGKLKENPSFAKIREITMRLQDAAPLLEQEMGGGGPPGMGMDPAAAGPAPTGPGMGGLVTPDAAQPPMTMMGPPNVVEGPPAQGGAALPTTSPTAGPGPIAPAAAAAGGPPPAPAGLEGMDIFKRAGVQPDAYGMLSPTDKLRVGETVRGVVTDEQTAKYEANLRAAAERERAASARQERGIEAASDRQATALQAAQERLEASINAAMSRVNAQIAGADNRQAKARSEEARTAAMRDAEKWKQTELLKIEEGLRAKDPLKKIDQKTADALKARVQEGYGQMITARVPGATLPGGPPAAPAAAPASPRAASPAPGGPPGPPASLDSTPQGQQAKGIIDQLRRQKVAPAQILKQLQTAGAPPDIVTAAKLYLGVK